MTREQLERWVTRTRTEQGLPPYITDIATVTAFAVLVVEATREGRAADVDAA